MRDRHRVGDALRRFDRRQQPGAADRPATGRFDSGNLALHVDNVLRAVGLRQAHDVRAAAHHRLQVRRAVGGVERIDAHDGFHLPVQRVLQRVIHQPARRVFFTQDHRVFQIEHQRIGLGR